MQKILFTNRPNFFACKKSSDGKPTQMLMNSSDVMMRRLKKLLPTTVTTKKQGSFGRTADSTAVFRFNQGLNIFCKMGQEKHAGKITAYAAKGGMNRLGNNLSRLPVIGILRNRHMPLHHDVINFVFKNTCSTVSSGLEKSEE